MNETSQEDSSLPDPWKMPSAKSFASVDIMAPLQGSTLADVESLAGAFWQHAHATKNGSNTEAAMVFRTLAGICSMHMRLEFPSQPYGPQVQLKDRRTLIPEDFDREGTETLRRIIPQVSVPALRARVADVVWLNNRADHQAGEEAYSSYCEIIEAVAAGKMAFLANDADVSLSQRVDLIHRAAQIASALDKARVVRPRLEELATSAQIEARDREASGIFIRASRICLSFNFLPAEEVAANAEQFASSLEEKQEYELSVKSVWDLAAEAYRASKNVEKQRDCRLRGISQLVAIADQPGQTPLLKAGHLRSAIQELRGIRGTAQLSNDILVKLRRAQEEAQDWPEFTHEIDLTEERASTAAAFEELTLGSALQIFAYLGKSPTLEDLRQQARDNAERHPLSTLFATTFADEDGKIIAEGPSGDFGGDLSEGWYQSMFARHEEFRRSYVVQSLLQPALITISKRWNITERNFLPIVRNSPFVPANHQNIFMAGLARLFQGDLISASHILLAQVEHSVRHLLKLKGVETSRLKADFTQEDITLSGIFDRLASDVDAIFTPPIALEIRNIFTQRPGPALRHEIAHGKISDGSCYTTDVFYACWFVYRLCCMPLAPFWDEQIGPAIDQST